MDKFRFLLFFFVPLYGLFIWIRNGLYQKGWLKSYEFGRSLIVVGGLDVGGSGKTPMIEYLIRLLCSSVKVATLSRGYGRVTKGFFRASEGVNASQIGDEPMQLYHKYRHNVTVAVSENRIRGIEQLIGEHDVILLDDAFQHRRVRAGLNIVLLDYHTIWQTTYLLPMGNAREYRSALKRAHVLVVTKAPKGLSNEEKERIGNHLNHSDLPIIYSHIAYACLKRLHDSAESLYPVLIPQIDAHTCLVLITGIAKTAPILDYLAGQSRQITHLKYADHHRFTLSDVTHIDRVYRKVQTANTILLTTEKDAMRLLIDPLHEIVSTLPIYYLPIETVIDPACKTQFDSLIMSYLKI